MRSVLPYLSDTEFDALETAILQIPALLDKASEERVLAIMDQLIGCLDASRIQHPDLAVRVAQLASKGGLPEIVDVDDEVGELLGEPITLRDHLDNAYDELTEVERGVLESLRQAVEATENDPDSTALDTLENVLPRAVEETEDLFVRARLHRARELIIRAAEVLTSRHDPQPGSPVGGLIVSLLLDAAKRPSTDDETDEQR